MPLLIMRLVSCLLLLGNATYALTAEHYQVKQIEYETEDGWTISGTLRLPVGAGKGNEYPGLILLHELEHDRNDFMDGSDNGIAGRLPGIGIATLAIDWRGRDRSMGKNQPVGLEVHDFTTKTLDNMYQDVVGGMEFLAGYPGVDSFRLGIVASHYSAEPAVQAMQELEIPTRVLVLLSGTNLSKHSKEYLARIDTPIYAAASILDKPVFKDMANVYANSINLNSYMIAPWSAGRGHNVLRHADDPINRFNNAEVGTMEGLDNWLRKQLKNLGRIREVSMKTKDGWTIHGNLRYPDELGKDGNLVPGVVMVSGARSHRYSMYRFEEELGRRGFVVLSVELRGRGQSTGGQTIDTPEMQEIRNNLLASPFEFDTVAAIDFLASQKGVDPERIGIVGQARGTRSALLAANGDSRVKSMVLISVYEPNNDMEQAISKMDYPILMIDGETNWAVEGTKHIYKFAKKGQLMIYPGLGHSHHVLEHNPQMADFIGEFMERELPKR